MSFLRRTALRVLTASPARVPVASIRPRAFSTYNPTSLRPAAAQWTAYNSAQIRRFSSGNDAITDNTMPDTAADASGEPAVDGVDAIKGVEAAPTPEGAAGGFEASPETAAATQAAATESNPARSTIYIGNLFFETDETKLRETFEPFGELNSVKVATDSRGLSRGFAFVEFADPACAKQAILEKDQQVLQGRRMAVQIHTPRPRLRSPQNNKSNPPSRTLFIGNMSFEMSDRDLNDLFRDIRNVLDVRVAIDRRSGQPRGFAHADFLDVKSAQEAYEALKEKTIYGRQLRVDYSVPSSQKQSAPQENFRD